MNPADQKADQVSIHKVSLVAVGFCQQKNIYDSDT
jgi:hypothetical protein